MKNHPSEKQCPTCGGKGRIGKEKQPWYKITGLFDGSAKKVMKVGSHDILVRGMLYEEQGGEPELAICVAPQAIGEKQGLALRQTLEANLRTPVLLLTDNIHLCKLVPIEDEEADKVLDSQNEEKN
jgi:hypothetical protein